MAARLLAHTDFLEPAELACSVSSSLRRWVLAAVAAEAWLALRFQPYSETPGRFGLAAALLTLCAIVAWRRRPLEPAATALASLLVTVSAFAVFPFNANHQWVAIVLLLILALPSQGDGAQARDALAGVRWVVILGIAWAGLQKIFYGSYFGAEFLSFRIATDPAFASIFSGVVPADEVARLQALAIEAGAGPFRAQAPMLVAISNLTWIAELVLPVLLVLPRTRRLAWPFAALFFLLLQAGARELFFALLMIGPLLTFASRNRVGQLLPLEVAVVFVWILLPDLAPGWRIR